MLPAPHVCSRGHDCHTNGSKRKERTNKRNCDEPGQRTSPKMSLHSAIATCSRPVLSAALPLRVPLLHLDHQVSTVQRISVPVRRTRVDLGGSKPTRDSFPVPTEARMFHTR